MCVFTKNRMKGRLKIPVSALTVYKFMTNLINCVTQPILNSHNKYIKLTTLAKATLQAVVPCVLFCYCTSKPCVCYWTISRDSINVSFTFRTNEVN